MGLNWMNWMKNCFEVARFRWLWLVCSVMFMLWLSISLAWVSTGYRSILGWESFFIATILAGGILLLAWRLFGKTALPKWLLFLLLGAALLRLVLGVVWFRVLPVGGYDSPAERKGYVMADAFNRDRAAWQMAHSKKPLTKALMAFRNFKKYDQYGGMLVISALVYRVTGTQTHQPLLMVVVTAAFSSLAVLLCWVFARTAWGDKVANVSAWGIALYPEAVLLGSSQMREAFFIPLVMAAFYGLLLYISHHNWRNLLWALLALGLILPFSPPIAALTLGFMVFMVLVTGDWHVLRQHKLWVIFASLALIASLGTFLAWKSYAPEGVSDPLALLKWWFRISSTMQARLTLLDSGWIQKIFASTPDWMHMPLMLLYGVVRPFLPAALVDIYGQPVWRWISIWRSIGWAILLGFLLVVPFQAFTRNARERHPRLAINRALFLIVWLAILLASFRGGADMWDNPRYRAIFAGLQVMLAAWVWVNRRDFGSGWFRRVFVGLGLGLAWFIPWYLRRARLIDWPLDDFFLTLGIGLASALCYMIWDVVRVKRK